MKIEKKKIKDEANSMNTSNIIKKIIIVIFIVLFIVAIFFGIKKYSGKIKGLFSDSSSIELKQTDTDTTIKEGVYLTDVSEVVENTMPSIVAITSKTLIQSGGYGPFSNNSEQYSEGAGSGIIISQTDDQVMILTNNHVVDGFDELTVTFIDEKEADATVVGTSESKDIAIIAVKTSDLDEDTMNNIKIATIGDSDELKVGNGIIAIGNALGYGQSVTTGVVSALNREITVDNYTNKFIQIDAAINGGNSGGALLNYKGEVVGINSAKYSSSGSSTSASIEGMGFAIPISDVKDLITDLMNGKGDTSSDSSIKLGIEGYMTTEYNFSTSTMPSGFYVSAIVDGGYASKSDLEIGNIITEIDGNTVNSVEDISTVLSTKKEGDKVKLKVKYINNRSYSEKTITISFK